MLARAQTFTIEGLQTRRVAVEVDIRGGLPNFAIVGLADAGVREARERVQAAILNSGYEFPARRITANLAPGDVPKAGPGFDLALACAVLAASGQLPIERLTSHALYGELSLDGEVRPCHGSLAIAQATWEAGMSALVLAPERAREASLVEGLSILAARSLQSVVRVLNGGAGDAVAPASRSLRRHEDEMGPGAEPDLGDVRGQRQAVRALLVAAAGAHNVLTCGPPGTGKTMLAQRLPSILPPLTRGEAIEVTRIHSITGNMSGEELVRTRPFRSPHHSVTTAGLIGGASRGWVGEVVLAHNGVLFLDELSEFSRTALEALRQPLEDGRVAIVRAQHSAVYPARLMLVAATNPCPCGYLGEAERCRCSEAELLRYRRKLSGPLLDRIDLMASVERPSASELREPPMTSSREARERVLLARERQTARLRDEGVVANAQMDVSMLRRHVALDESGVQLLREVQEQDVLSARGQHRLLRVARTVADLEGSERTRGQHLAEAMGWRPEAALQSRRVA
ncbi:MAG TPA: YifB family Mg chelatase-like AAA ATPase [Solirubrobacteraceae bacterium]|jgi:magnesium chelatase family protein